jgi:chemotaxis receptor (MCP) glutamine deamidase CheD
VSPKELTYILSKLPQEQFQQIKAAFAGTALELQTPSTAELEELQKTDRQHNIGREMIAQINSLGQKQNTGNFTADHARGILQTEMGFTNAESEKPILGTFGAGPCIAIAVYNPETKTASLAHFDELTDINSIDDLFYQLSENSRATLEVHLAGGSEESRDKVTEVINRIRRQENVEIKSAAVIHKNDFNGKSLAIDARTGEIFTQFYPQQLDNGEEIEARIRLLGMLVTEIPLQCIYDGRNKKTQTDPPSKIQADFTRARSIACEGLLVSRPARPDFKTRKPC